MLQDATSNESIFLQQDENQWLAALFLKLGLSRGRYDTYFEFDVCKDA